MDDFPTSGEFRIGFQMDLNELKGGTATATLYSNESGSFASTGLSTTYVDTGDDTWMYDEFDYTLNRGGAPGKTAKVKIVINYTYPDGISETLESPEMFVYAGTFVTPKSASVSGPAGSQTLTVEFKVDSGMVNISQIDLGDAYYNMVRVIDDDNTEYVPLSTPDMSWNGDVVRMVFSMTDTLMPGQYRFDFSLYYNDWEGNSNETFNVD